MKIRILAILTLLVYNISFSQSPGGVQRIRLRLWLKANEGTNIHPTMDGEGITAWADQSQYGNHATGKGTAVYNEDSFNYNPTINFTNDPQPIEGVITRRFGAGSTVFVVKKVNVTTSRAFVDFRQNSSGRNQYLFDDRYSGGPAGAFNVSLGTIDILTALDPGGADPASIFENGKLLTVTTKTNTGWKTGVQYFIGDDFNGNNRLTGDIAEVIYYDRELGDVGRSRVSSYLAIKYGITLSNAAGGNNGDYRNGANVVIWDASINGTYQNDIIGITRDDNSALDQQKSSENNVSSMLTIDKGGSFANDHDAVLVGHDVENYESEGAMLPSDLTNKAKRTWKVATHGTPGDISVSFKLGGSIPNTGNADDYSILKDTDTDFSDATTHTTGRTITGDILTFTNVAFSDGEFFTLGFKSVSPGNIASDLILWLKADAGTNTTTDGAGVTAWADQSTKDNDATGTGAAVYNEDTFNFNPTIRFTNDAFPFEGPMERTTGTASTIFVVKKNKYLNNRAFAEFSNGVKGTGGGNRQYFYNNRYASNIQTPPTSRDETNILTVSDPGGFTPSNVYEDGAVLFGNLTKDENTSWTTGGSYYIGDDLTGGNRLTGDIAEVIYYDRLLDEGDRRNVSSYLALKYGVTLSNTAGGDNGDYVLNSGLTTVWDASAMGVYHNNVFGVAKDSNSGLSQLKSKSENNGIVTIDATGTTSFDDFDYIVAGSDIGGFIGTTIGAHPDFPNRVLRTWRVSSNNTAGSSNIGTVDVSFELSGTIPNTGTFSEYALLVDDTDTDFSDATKYTTGTLVGSTLTFTGIPLEDSNFLTLAFGTLESPGGVFANLSHWLKADRGTSSTTDGDELTEWENIKGANATRSLGVNDPEFEEVKHNFNPSVHFLEGDEGFFNLDLEAIKGTSFNTISIVERNVYNNERNYFLGTQREVNANEGLHIGYRDNVRATIDKFLTDLNTPVTGYDAPQSVALFSAGLDTSEGQHVYELRNQVVSSNSDSKTSVLTGPGPGVLGKGYNISGFRGYVSEVIIYNDNVSDDDLRKIYTYLATKYGLTLELGNYISSDDTVIFDATANADYYDNIGVIGRDDISLLNQKQSKSSNIGSILTVSLGTTVETSNVLNTNTFEDDLDFLAWGVKTTTSDPVTICGLATEKFTRDWKVQNTGDVGAVTLQFDMTGIVNPSEFDLVIDADGDLVTPAGQTIFDTGVLSGDNLTFSGVVLPNNAVFTLVRTTGFDIVYDGTSWSGGSGAGGIPTIADTGKTVLIEGSVTAPEDFNCNCLKIETSQVLTISTDKFVHTDGVLLDGDLYLEGTAELAQTILANGNAGTGNVYKILGEATESLYRYNYFTSPVHNLGTYSLIGNLKLNTGATLGDNTDPVFTSSLDEPGEISRRWIHRVNNELNFIEVDENEAFPSGVGFTMKGTDVLNKYNFIGTPHNADISVPLTAGNFLLTGNPYPSTIDARVFNTLNSTVTESIIYLWDEPTGSDHFDALINDRGGYATIGNGLTVASATLMDGTTGVVGATTPTFFIKPGQGFLVYGENTGDVVFNNSLRDGVSRTGNHFFKTKKLQTLRSVIRLGFEYNNKKGQIYHRQIATVLDGGSLEKESGKDAFMFDYNNNDAYWVIPNEEDRFVITSVPTINDDLELPIGVVVDETREVTFKLDATEFLFGDVYLYDNQESIRTNLNNGNSYKVTLDSGDYRDRFSLVFKEDSLLNVKDIDKDDNIDNNIESTITVLKSEIKVVLGKGVIEKVELYSLSGRKVLSSILEQKENNVLINSGNLSSNIYMIKVITNLGTITKKIVVE